MINREKRELLQSEIDKMYKDFFEEEKKQKFKNEKESYQCSDRFHEILSEYIRKRIKELEINLDTE